MSTVVLNDSWRAWVLENIDRGCTQQSMVDSMVEAGWPVKVAPAIIEHVLRERELFKSINAVPRLVDLPAPVSVSMALKMPPILVLDNLLTDEECDTLIKDATPRLTDSSVVETTTGNSVPSENRISRGMFFQLAETPTVARIEDRLVKMFDWTPKHHEGLQVLHYGIGGRYDPHHDYFLPSTESATKLTAETGQRLGTVLLYLNTPEEGGGTQFTDIGLEVAARKGSGVFFSYDRPHPSTRTLHAGLPVVKGEKWVATFWFREKADETQK